MKFPGRIHTNSIASAPLFHDCKRLRGTCRTCSLHPRQTMPYNSQELVSGLQPRTEERPMRSANIVLGILSTFCICALAQTNGPQTRAQNAGSDAVSKSK